MEKYKMNKEFKDWLFDQYYFPLENGFILYEGFKERGGMGEIRPLPYQNKKVKNQRHGTYVFKMA